MAFNWTEGLAFGGTKPLSHSSPYRHGMLFKLWCMLCVNRCFILHYLSNLDRAQAEFLYQTSICAYINGCFKLPTKYGVVMSSCCKAIDSSSGMHGICACVLLAVTPKASP